MIYDVDIIPAAMTPAQQREEILYAAREGRAPRLLPLRSELQKKAVYRGGPPIKYRPMAGLSATLSDLLPAAAWYETPTGYIAVGALAFGVGLGAVWLFDRR